MKNSFSRISFTLLALILTQCGGGSSSSSVDSTAFPSGLALTSPLDLTTAEASLSAPNGNLTNLGPQFSFTANQAAISTILTGTTIADCSFDASAILTNLSDNADCYGPALPYTNHPNAGETGTLPPGDVGLWTTEEGATTEACAAAQLNTRMNGIGSKTQAALEAMASMICVANVNSVALPTSGSEIDLLAEMNAMSTSNGLGYTFTDATLGATTVDSHDAYTYSVTFSFTSDSKTYNLTLAMTHVLLDSSNITYKGRFSYIYNSNFDSGNCPIADLDSDGVKDVTIAGSVLYDLSAANNMVLRADAAQYCGHNAAAVDGTTGLISASDVYDAGTNTDGWGDNFTSVIANFNPDTAEGNYTMAWQAGRSDSNSRVFNLNIDVNGSSRSGEAFFGFGDIMEDWDGNIGGMICNWAGPGQDHTLVDFVQHQTLSQTGSETVFSQTDSDIQYAPLVACSYGGGPFSYDIDGDSDNDATDATDVGDGVSNGMLPITTDTDADGTLDELETLGFTNPTAPTNF